MLKIKFTFVILFVLSYFFQLSAQDRSLKVYANIQYLNSRPMPSIFNYTPALLAYNGISLAYSVKKEMWKNEFEIGGNIYHLDEPFAEGFSYYLRYEKGYYTPLEILKKGKLAFGLAGKIFYLGEYFRVSTVGGWPLKNEVGGLALEAFIHIEYKITNQFYLDLNSNFSPITFGLNRLRIDNPNLSVRQRTTGGFDFDMLSERLLRIGFAYKFKQKKINKES